jgi:multiple sugar transport system ATP-binding protein
MATIKFEQVSKQFGDGTVAVDKLDLKVDEGEFLILVGPSGCGKTTALRMVAGLEEVSDGSIFIGDREVTNLAPVDRDVAMVFQNYALYPHMSVEDNILFPLRQKRVKKAEARERAHEVARLLAIEELLHRKPRALSGGQRQRVAIGRALVRRPLAFLMDEPLSNLDAKLRVQMRAELLSLHKQVGITTIYVTHDQTEAMTLGDRVVVLNKGVVQQIASPQELYRAPVNMFVAGFIGSPAMNFLRGRIDNGTLRIGDQSLALNSTTANGEVIVGIRPEDFVTANGDGLEANVAFVENLGPESLVHFTTPGFELADVTAHARTDEADDSTVVGGLVVARVGADTALGIGEQSTLRLKLNRFLLFDATSGNVLT